MSVLQCPAFSAAQPACSVSPPDSALSQFQTVAGPIVSHSHPAQKMPATAPCQPQPWTPTKPGLPDPCFAAGSWAASPHGSCTLHWSSGCATQSGYSFVPLRNFCTPVATVTEFLLKL